MSGVCWVTGEVRYCHGDLYIKSSSRPAQGDLVSFPHHPPVLFNLSSQPSDLGKLTKRDNTSHHFP